VHPAVRPRAEVVEDEVIEPKAGTFKMAEEPAPPKKKPAKVVGGGKGKEPAPPPAAAPMTPGMKARAAADDDEDAESVKKGYGVLQETEAEKEAAEKNKPKYTEVQDKFKKSARGPAIAMLVMPTNLLTAEGLLTCVGGLVYFVYGMWPLVFSDAPPGDEEIEEAIRDMIMGLIAFGWGALVLIGTSQMQDVSSYPCAVARAVVGIIPLFVGIFALIMLMNPKVKAGFEETEGGPDDEDDDDIAAKDDDDDDEDEDDEDDEPRKKRKK